MNRASLSLVLALVLMTFMAGSAMATGTSGDTGVIYNGVFNSGDTVPQGAGEMSIRYRKTATDSRYAFVTDGNTTAITVDTAYDLQYLNRPADSNAAQGDTLAYVYYIENLSNAAIWIDLDTQKLYSGDSDWGRVNYRIFFDTGAGGFTYGDSLYSAETAAATLRLAAGAARQILLTVYIPDTASAGDSSTISIMVRDSAPIAASSVTGDGWESGLPLAGNDSRDTQWDTVVTTVRGPNLKVSKTVTELNGTRSRPGDTLIFQITFDNDGNDSAYGVQIIDAVPANTRYIANSADSGNFCAGCNQAGGTGNVGGQSNGNRDTEIDVSLDSDVVGSSWTFNDSDALMGGRSDTLTVRAIQWTITPAVGEDTGDGLTTAADFGNGIYDSGRVEFRVTIQ